MDAELVNDSRTLPPRPVPPRGMFGLRVAIVAIAGILGVTLLATGHVVIGFVLVVLTVLRALFLVRMRRYRNERLAYREAMRARRRGAGL